MHVAIIEDVQVCIRELQKTCVAVKQIANDIITSDIDKIEHLKLHSAKQDVKELVPKAYTFIDNVEDIFYYWSKMKGGDTSLVNATFIDNFKKLLSKCEQLYKEFKEAAKQTQKSTSRAATECDNLYSVDSDASAGLIAIMAAGVVAGSIVAGIFTFGIGTVVGLATGAAAVYIAGTATAEKLASEATAAKNSDAAKTFRRIGSRLNNLERATDSFTDSLHTLIRDVDNFERALENTSAAGKKQRFD